MIKLWIVFLFTFMAPALCPGEDYLNQGARYLNAGNYDKAVRSYELALKSNGGSAEAYKGLGQSYYKLGDQEIAYDVEKISAAVNALSSSLALKKDPEVYYLLGVSYLALYDKEKAEAAYASLKAAGSELAGQLALKIAAYVKPATFNYGHAAAPRGDPRGDLTPVAIAGNQVLVPVTLSYRGRSADATLLLDTGASVTGISGRLAEQLGVETADTLPGMATVADGRSVHARWFCVDSLGVGARSLANLRVGILPGSIAGVDGLLGMDFLKNFRYQVNFSRSAIEWQAR